MFFAVIGDGGKKGEGGHVLFGIWIWEVGRQHGSSFWGTLKSAPAFVKNNAT